MGSFRGKDPPVRGIAIGARVCDRVKPSRTCARKVCAMCRQGGGPDWFFSGENDVALLQEVKTWRESGAGAGVWTSDAQPVVGGLGCVAVAPGPPRCLSGWPDV